MNNKKILVLGASGMAGHIITIYLKERGYTVVGYSRKPIRFCDNIIGDIIDKDQLREILSSGNFDTVINCIGILNQFAEEDKFKAITLNSYLPYFIADIIKGTKTQLIHMSTDCVFAGNTGPYFESSFPDGKSFYDRTKALGEINDNSNLTFRNSIIGPDMNEQGIGLFNWFMKQNDRINGYCGAMWTGVTTLTLAKAMDAAMCQNLSGLFNLVNNENISKYDLLCLFNKYFKSNKLTIKSDDSVQLDKTLICTRTDFNFIIPSYEQQIMEMRAWIIAHKFLYPHYDL